MDREILTFTAAAHKNEHRESYQHLITQWTLIVCTAVLSAKQSPAFQQQSRYIIQTKRTRNSHILSDKSRTHRGARNKATNPCKWVSEWVAFNVPSQVNLQYCQSTNVASLSQPQTLTNACGHPATRPVTSQCLGHLQRERKIVCGTCFSSVPLSLAPELFGSTDISWPALSFPTIKVCCAGKDVFQDCLLHVQRRQKEVWDGAKPQGIWGTGVPARSMGGAPVDGLGDEVHPQKLKNFKVVTSKFYAFLLVFNTFSPIYAYVFFLCLQASFH